MRSDLVATCREGLSATHSAELESLLALIERSPTNPVPIHQLALVCRQYGYAGLWQHAVREALALPHITNEQIYHRANAKLTLGDWSGWADREARLFDPRSNKGHLPYWKSIRWTNQAWDGKEDIRDKVIFVIADGGLGDCIQMLRFIPVIANASRQVIVGVRPELVSLVQHNFGDRITVTVRDVDHAMPFQRYIWMMSLPALLGELPSFAPLVAPRPIPHISPSKLRVGVCWAGSPHHPQDRHRSLCLHALAPLFALEKIEWHSVQAGSRATDAGAYSAIRQPSTMLHDFADTANIVATMDAVVTVDTSVAHLSGSLGIPTFVLLGFAAEFRWGLGNTTPWYPSIRLLRQRHPDEWGPVVDAVGVELDTHARDHAD